MKIKRWMALCLAALVTVTGAASAWAGESTSETEAMTEAQAQGPETGEEALQESIDGIIADLIGDMKVEELLDLAMTILKVTDSEEFQHLMEYPEMQALAETVVKRCIRMFVDDPELAEKIMTTLGVDERAAAILAMMAEEVKNTDTYKELVLK